VSCKAGRYYVSVLIEIPDIEKPQLNDFRLGIDLGVKEFAVISNIKKDLKLSDREYICECGYHADRDYNASLNLRDAVSYKIA